MDWIIEIFESGWYMKVINSIIVILVSIIVYRLVVKIINKSECHRGRFFLTQGYGEYIWRKLLMR